MNKKFIYILVSIISVSAMLFTSCKKEETVDWIKFNKIYFSPETILLEPGETANISVIALYTDASEVDVTDSVTIVCDNPSAVKYENGKVTAITDGTVSLSTYYNGSKAECKITASSIEKIVLSVGKVNDDLLLIPGEKVSGENVVVTAFYKAGDKKVVNAEITSADPEVLSINRGADGKISEIQAVKNNGETSMNASHKTINGNILKDDLKVYTAQLDSAVITLGATKLDTTKLNKGKPKYQRDTLRLGAKSDVLVTGYFSWSKFKDKDTVDARSLVEKFTYDHKYFYVDNTEYTVDAIGVTPTPNIISASLFGETYGSRFIDVVKDTIYKAAPTYKVSTDVKYAYDDDVINFKFTEEYVSESGSTTMSLDLTNTGNTDITSGYYITEPKTTFCDPTLFKLCTGKIQLSEQASVQAIKVNNEDSTGIVVIYKTSSKIDTVYSNQFKLYTHPQMSYADWTRKDYGENIILNWFSNHLWEDEAEVVDNFGNRYTVANGGIETTQHASNHDLKVYYVALEPHMYNRTYTFTYGPEKRQCMITIGDNPQN